MIDITYKPCRRCQPTGGKYLIQLDEHEEEIAVKCQCYVKFLHDKNLAIKIHQSGMSDFMFDYDIDIYIGKDEVENIPKLQHFLDKFDEKYYNKHLYFYGNNACQKTTLASWVGKQLLLKDKSVQFVIMNDLINMLKNVDFVQNEKAKEGMQEYIDSLTNCDLLIIDDAFDNKKSLTYKNSDYLKSFIDTFLRRRLEVVKKSTIVTSNIKIEDIKEEDYSVSIKSLVERNFHVLEFYDHYIDVDVDSFWD